MKKIAVLTAVFILSAAGLGRALIGVNPAPDVNAEINSDANGVSTSMNGSTTTNTGNVPISSTSASKESRNTDGTGD